MTEALFYASIMIMSAGAGIMLVLLACKTVYRWGKQEGVGIGSKMVIDNFRNGLVIQTEDGAIMFIKGYGVKDE